MMKDLVMGVDEAGRGSVVGDMVVAGYLVREDEIDLLTSLGVRDSKELSPRARARLFRDLSAIGIPVAVSIPPSDIDRANINRLTVKAIVKLYNVAARIAYSQGYVIKRVTIDGFGGRRSVIDSLRSVGFRGEVVVEEKADSNYPEVSAASIVAKHLRDTRIEVLRSLYGVEGSGYPSDPRTLEWIRGVLARGERVPVIRYSWATIERLRGRPKSLYEFMGGSGG